MHRRSFLKHAGIVAGAAAIPFTALNARTASPSHAVRRGHTAGYGPLFPVADETTGLPLITLPRGFKYLTFGWTGDPLTSGGPTPGAHDGMAAFTAMYRRPAPRRCIRAACRCDRSMGRF